MSKTLRPYQEIALSKITDALQRGVNKQILCLATGLGKTYTAVQATKPYNRVLWVTHTEELLSQSALAFIREMFDESFASHVENIGFINYIEQGGLFALNGFSMGAIRAGAFYPNGNVVVASSATLYRRLDRLPPDSFDMIVVDECHMAAAKTWVKSLTHFTPKLLLGLTATPHRQDNLQLGNVFDEIVYDYGIADGIKNGYLCEMNAVRIKTTVSLDSVRTIAGELNQKDLSNEVNTPERNHLVVSSYLKYAKGRQGIFYCVDVEHAVQLAEIFNEHGISCKPVVGDEEVTPERSQTMKDFKANKITVLTNCMVLTAGVDIPNVGCIGNAAPTKSLTKFLQCVGRGTRLKNEEYVRQFGQNCIVLDFIDLTTRHNLVNAWELDKEKKAEDKVFITSENREKLFEVKRARSKLQHTRAEDEFVNLLKLPKPKISNSIRMTEQATEAQLKWISSLGYDVETESYTKAMCSQIIMDLPCTDKQLSYLKGLKYDISSVTVVTRGMAEAAISEHKKKLEKLERETNQNNIKNNLPFKF